MEAYAVIETGGKQYRVTKGDVLNIERLNDTEEGKNVKIENVLAVSDGSALTIGTPTVKGAAVTAKVVENLRGDKVISYKKKRRKSYERTIGHRQNLTKIEIVDIGGGKKKAAKAKDEPAEADKE